MAEVWYPGQAAAMPTVTTSTTVQTRFDPLYLNTASGILKIVQVTSSLLGFICIQASVESGSPRGQYFSWISMIAFWFSGILLGLYCFHVVEKHQHKIPWLKIELGFCGLWTFFFLLASSLTIGSWENNPFIAAGTFGIKATTAYGIDVYLKWGGVRRGSLAQAPSVASAQTAHAGNICHL